ncbi:MAG TPA: methyltransferase [Tepidisphaeraceae bacterium]|jgi:hypothetical protein|nr:methyltransferase [Tepidisphaeraceae bacterium]
MLELQLGEYVPAALNVAIHFGVLDALDHSTDLSEISASLDLDRECLERLLQLLAASTILLRRSNGKYVVDAQFRDFVTWSGPLFIGSATARSTGNIAYQKLVAGISGDATRIRETFCQRWRRGLISEEEARGFLFGMHRHIMAPMLEQVRSRIFDGIPAIVDAGGGSGALAVALSLEESAVSPPLITIMDLDNICVASSKMNSTFGMDRIRYHPSNFFVDPWVYGEAYHFSNILHDWPELEITFLLKRAYDHMPTGGVIFIHEALLDTPEPTPISTHVLHLLIYIHSGGGKLLQQQVFMLLQGVGFADPEVIHRFSIYSTIRATKP